jgi:uncharacterized protein YdeI (YjbR/CyaY-like superfamily)
MPIRAQFFRTPAALRRWFERHHADTSEIWIGFHKAHTGKAGVNYSQAVEEALCFGWIDTTVRRIDVDRYAHRFTPRRPDSSWSEVNRRKFAELTKAGRVHESGHRAFARQGTTVPRQFTSDRIFRFAPTLAARLRARAVAERYFHSRSRGYRRRATFWVMSAVRPETRERRFTTLLEASSRRTIPRALFLPGEMALPPARASTHRDRRSRTSGPRRRQSRGGRR